MRMSSLSTRVRQLEAQHATPADQARAAKAFDELLDQMVKRFAPEQENVSDAEQEEWSRAQRTAWRMRFRGESLEQALVSVGLRLPRNGIEIALSQMDAGDWAL